MGSTVTDRVTGISTSVAVKAPVKDYTTGNINLSGLGAQAGGNWSSTLAAGDRILVQAQTTASDNGIYVASTSEWSRAKDFDGQRDVVEGTIIPVGPTGQQFRVLTSDPIVIGSTGLAFIGVPRADVLSAASRAEMKSEDADVGQVFELLEGGRSGTFVVKSGTPPSDPKEGIYVVMDNGNYAERLNKSPMSVRWFGALGGGMGANTVADTNAFLAAEAMGGAVAMEEGSYTLSETLLIEKSHFYGEGASKTIINYVGTGFCIQLKSGETGAFFEKAYINSDKSSGQNGVYASGAVNGNFQDLYINNFTGTALRYGISGANGIYWSDLRNIRIVMTDTSLVGDTGLIIDGGIIPSSNNIVATNVTMGGVYLNQLVINGSGNTFLGGNIETRDIDVNTATLINISGNGNVIRDMYIEPVSFTAWNTSKLAVLSGDGNEIELWNAFGRANVYDIVDDTGQSNVVKIRAPGRNFSIGLPHQGQQNFIPNSNFEVFRDANNPVGWLNGTSGVSKETSVTRNGIASLKMVSSASRELVECFVTNYFTTTTNGVVYPASVFQDQNITLAIWCKSDTPGGIASFTGIGVTGNSWNHSGSDQWELLIAHSRVEAGASRVGIRLESDDAGNTSSKTMYWSEPVLILGTEASIYGPAPLTDQGGITCGDLEFVSEGTAPGDTKMLKLGNSWLWVDPSSGKLRIKTGSRPTDLATSGAVVGTQT